MSDTQNLTKEQLIKAIEKIENNPGDRVGIIADIGATALGAAGAAAAAAALGTTAASIPVITALTGIGMVVATPLTLVAGAALAGGAAVYGVSRLIKDGGFHEGKRDQLLNEYKERLKDVEAKERRSSFDEHDKTKFYSFLKEPLQHNLITPQEAQQLMKTVENGHLSLSEAYKLVGQILSDGQITQPEKAYKLVGQTLSDGQTTQPGKVVIHCPSCSQKLRAPSSLGKVILTCSKCKHRWSWVPK